MDRMAILAETQKRHEGKSERGEVATTPPSLLRERVNVCKTKYFQTVFLRLKEGNPSLPQNYVSFLPQLEVVDRTTNHLHHEVTHVSTITEGTSSSVGISRGGSVSHDVNAKVSANIKGVFTAELGVSRHTETNWAHTSSQTFQSSRSTQVRIPVKKGN